MTPARDPAIDAPAWIAGEPVRTDRVTEIPDRHTGAAAGLAHAVGPGEVERAIAAASAAERACRELPGAARAGVCRSIAEGLRARREAFARTLVAEVGKTIPEARAEVDRAVETFEIAQAEATRIGGALIPLDGSARSARTEAVARRVPVGACAFITPFNFPLNLAAHKIAPAIACGCPFVLKPSDKTPLTTAMLGELLDATEWPRDAWSLFLCSVGDAAPLVEDPRLRLLSFTGSVDVGWSLRARAGKKRVVLELGGDAACVVDEGADVERAVERVAFGGYALAGQSCISVQRALVHESLAERFTAGLVERARSIVPGDPLDEATGVGPMIDEAAATRVESWIAEAVDRGARLLCGGERRGAAMTPAVLADVPDDATIAREEVFGPVVCVRPVSSLGEAIDLVNASRFGLQAGVFTPSLSGAMRAWRELEVGAVVINDAPTFRADAMPYGGVKDSGAGREGVRSAIGDMTEERLLVLREV